MNKKYYANHNSLVVGKKRVFELNEFGAKSELKFMLFRIFNEFLMNNNKFLFNVSRVLI